LHPPAEARGRQQPRATTAAQHARGRRTAARGLVEGGDLGWPGEEEKFSFWGDFEGEIRSPNSEFQPQKPQFSEAQLG